MRPLILVLVGLAALAAVTSPAEMMLQVSGEVQSITAKQIVIQTDDSVITVLKTSLSKSVLDNLSKPHAQADLFVATNQIVSIRETHSTKARH